MTEILIAIIIASGFFYVGKYKGKNEAYSNIKRIGDECNEFPYPEHYDFDNRFAGRVQNHLVQFDKNLEIKHK